MHKMLSIKLTSLYTQVPIFVLNYTYMENTDWSRHIKCLDNLIYMANFYIFISINTHFDAWGSIDCYVK